MLITKCYTMGYDVGEVQYFDFTRVEPRKTMNVFLYTACAYRNRDGLRTYHNRKRVWAVCYDGNYTRSGVKRSKQIEKVCKQARAKCEKM